MKFVLFLLNPFLSGIRSLVCIKEKHALVFLYLWFIMFGIGFVANYEAADSYRNVERFKETPLNWQQYKYEVEDYFSFETKARDIYVLTANFIVRQFTDNYHWEYFLFAIIFGFFYIKSLKYLIPYLSKSSISYILLFLFCFSNPIFNINGVRFWTAAWIGVYALFRIFIDKKYIYYLLLAITPLIHGSFYLWVMMVILAQILPKNRKVWIALFVISMFVSLSSQVSQIANFSSQLPPFMQNYIELYMENEEIVDFNETQRVPLYARILNTLPSVILTILTLLLTTDKNIENKKKDEYLMEKYLIIVTMVNFASVVPTVGVRYIRLTMPILAILWARYSFKLKKYNWAIYCVPIAFSYSVYYWIINVTSVTEPYLYLLPAPITMIKYLFYS